MHATETGNMTYVIIIVVKKTRWFNINCSAKEMVKLADKIHISVKIINLRVKGIVFFISVSPFIFQPEPR